MLPKITEEELQVFETLQNPISEAEILFSNMDNLAEFDLEKSSTVRKYQYPMLSYDSLFFENKDLSKKENFNLKKGMSEGYILGGRLTGKTMVGLIVDCLLAIVNKTFDWGVVSSLDAIHIRGVLEKIINALEYHPLLKNFFDAHILRSPAYKIHTKNGCLLESVNNNLAGKNPGAQFFGKHISKHWQEESSFITFEITHKLLMAQSELGCIDRWSGMTTFAKNSPMGKIFSDLKNENKIVNLPSYSNPSWDKEKDEAAILEFGGKNSQGYQVQVVGKIVENGDSVFDMERIRDTYKRDKNGDPIAIKAFEINKDNFFKYKEELILERPTVAEKCIVALDKGEGAAPTEIIVIFQIAGQYIYTYNITCYKLKVDEDEEIVNWVINQVTPNYIGIDITSGTGKTLLSALSKKFPENVIGVSFNEKIDIDFEKDEKGNIKYDNAGKPNYKQEYIVDWSIQQLKSIFYNKKIKCFMDYKLDNQFGGVVVMKSGIRTVYGYKTENHLFQAFQVFSIVHWMSEFKNTKPAKRKKPGFGSFGSHD